jgi:anthranilate synthase/aminodeoxychorismate synthase-like glutamine amidotransferase
MILVLDNYDSFTYNLVQYLYDLGQQVEVFRNDALDIAGLRARKPEKLVISPGPCTPKEAGITLEAVRQLSGSLPILGVCLGHQAIGEAFGGKVVLAQKVMHGKTSAITHVGRGLFAGVSSPMQAGRYHSLAIEKASLPSCLMATAWTEDDGEIMAVAHREHPTVGVQFHPESVLTPHGKRLLQNFVEGSL